MNVYMQEIPAIVQSTINRELRSLSARSRKKSVASGSNNGLFHAIDTTVIFSTTYKTPVAPQVLVST
jgi:hypothetical protein